MPPFRNFLAKRFRKVLIHCGLAVCTTDTEIDTLIRTYKVRISESVLMTAVPNFFSARVPLNRKKKAHVPRRKLLEDILLHFL